MYVFVYAMPTNLLFIDGFWNGLDIAHLHMLALQHVLLQVQPVGNLWKHKSISMSIYEPHH